MWYFGKGPTLRNGWGLQPGFLQSAAAILDNFERDQLLDLFLLFLLTLLLSVT